MVVITTWLSRYMRLGLSEAKPSSVPSLLRKTEVEAHIDKTQLKSTEDQSPQISTSLVFRSVEKALDNLVAFSLFSCSVWCDFVASVEIETSFTEGQ